MRKYLCPKCRSVMDHKPEREEHPGDFCATVVNWYECPQCKFKGVPIGLMEAGDDDQD